jgi:hypothetical protein
MHRLITSELRDAGFDSAQISAVKRIEVEVIACTFDLSSLPRIEIDTRFYFQSWNSSLNGHMSMRTCLTELAQLQRILC